MDRVLPQGFWYQDEGFAVRKAVDAEVAMVQGEDGAQAFALSHSDQDGIREVHGMIAVLAHERSKAGDVRRGDFGNPKPSAFDELPEAILREEGEREEMGGFREDRPHGNERSPDRPERLDAAGMVGVVPIEQGNERTRVNENDGIVWHREALAGLRAHGRRDRLGRCQPAREGPRPENMGLRPAHVMCAGNIREARASRPPIECNSGPWRSLEPSDLTRRPGERSASLFITPCHTKCMTLWVKCQGGRRVGRICDFRLKNESICDFQFAIFDLKTPRPRYPNRKSKIENELDCRSQIENRKWSESQIENQKSEIDEAKEHEAEGRRRGDVKREA